MLSTSDQVDYLIANDAVNNTNPDVSVILMSTATETPDVVSSDSTAITTKKTSSKIVPQAKCLTFSNKKTYQGLAADAKSQYEKVVAYAAHADVSLDDLYVCAEAHHKSGATALAVATAGYMWLTEGALLDAMKARVKAAGNDWQSYYEEKLKPIFGGKSIRSEQVCRQMFTNHREALKKDADMVERAINENGKVNDLAKSLKTIASGDDPWRAQTPEEKKTYEAKKLKALEERPNKLVEELQIILATQGYSERLQDYFDEFVKAMKIDKVDPKIVDDTNVIDVEVDIPEPFTMEGLERQSKPLTNLVMS